MKFASDFESSFYRNLSQLGNWSWSNFDKLCNNNDNNYFFLLYMAAWWMFEF